MSLSQALSAAVQGLKVSQAGLTLVAANVANADTPGYVRKSVAQVEIAGNNEGISVRVSEIRRELDLFVQRQLRTENAGASFADTRARIYAQLQGILGAPGESNSLEAVYNNFTTALQALATSPDDTSARSAALSAAQLFTQQLNQASDGVQALRSDAELGISDAISKAQIAIDQIADLNQRILGSATKDGARAALLDQRDAFVDQLSQLFDINVVNLGNDQVSILTVSGVELVGTQAAKLSFNPQPTVTPTNFWDPDPSKSTLGTITLTAPNGNAIDLVRSNAFRSGTVAALLQLRDDDLVRAQAQLDGIASALASALSDKTTTVTPAPAPPLTPQTADIDIGSLSAGNKITINYTDTLTGPHTITFVRVDDPSVLPLSDDATLTPNDHVVGIDFSAGFASAFSQISNALSSTGLTATNPPSPPAPTPTTLHLSDDGGTRVRLNSLSTTVTATSFSGGSSELPFFTDGSSFYTGAIFAGGNQSVGLSSRISVNALLFADPSRLVKFSASTATGDSTRPDFILKQLTNSTQLFSPDTGIGSEGTPFSGSISTFLRQVLSQQGETANSAQSLKEGQDIVLNTLQQRFEDASGVNIDQELAGLTLLQTAYAANARVLTAVNDLLNTLLRI
jgi:flagellar hook-associated protein 1 FlgK